MSADDTPKFISRGEIIYLLNEWGNGHGVSSEVVESALDAYVEQVRAERDSALAVIEKVRELYGRRMAQTTEGCGDDEEMFLFELRALLSDRRDTGSSHDDR